jgi:osmotically-inducible protein OsmY
MSERSATEIRPAAQSALSDSPIFALRELTVEQTDESLLISGSVPSYYYKQLAQEIVRTVANGIEVVNSIRVR